MSTQQVSSDHNLDAELRRQTSFVDRVVSYHAVYLQEQHLLQTYGISLITFYVLCTVVPGITVGTYMSGAKTLWKKEQVARFGFESKKASNEEVAFQLAFLEDDVFAKVPFDCCCTPDVQLDKIFADVGLRSKPMIS